MVRFFLAITYLGIVLISEPLREVTDPKNLAAGEGAHAPFEPPEQRGAHPPSGTPLASLFGPQGRRKNTHFLS